MATGLDAQYLAALDATFQNRVTLAIMVEAYTVSTEATTLSANLPVTATTSIPITPALTVSVASGTVVNLGGGQTATLSSTANSGATSLPVTSFTPAQAILAGTLVSPPTVYNHAARAALALQIMTNPTNFTLRFALSCAAQSLDNTSTDAQIQSGCSTVWNLIAGA